MDQAEEFAAEVERLYGADLCGAAGVIHVTSAWACPDGRWRSLRIGPDAPASMTDAFALATARARADAIVTTGASLRAEPKLEHALGPAASAWRHVFVGKGRAPHSVVLTRRADLALDHPLFAANEAPVLVLTTPAAARALRARVAARARCGIRDQREGIVVVSREHPSLRDTLAWLRREIGCETTLVEAGATTSRELYDEPLGVDELMLSIYLGETLPADVQGAPFLAPDHPQRAAIEASHASSVVRREASGAWRFLRHRFGGEPGLQAPATSS